MLVTSRFRFPDGSVEQRLGDLSGCLDRLGRCEGFVSGAVGRALDDPELWLLTTSWANVGAYRRAMSSNDVKMHVVPLLSDALDEPSAFEVLAGDGATVANVAKPRGGS
jgi:hypothetical protein